MMQTLENAIADDLTYRLAQEFEQLLKDLISQGFEQEHITTRLYRNDYLRYDILYKGEVIKRIKVNLSFITIKEET